MRLLQCTARISCESLLDMRASLTLWTLHHGSKTGHGQSSFLPESHFIRLFLVIVFPMIARKVVPNTHIHSSASLSTLWVLSFFLIESDMTVLDGAYTIRLVGS